MLTINRVGLLNTTFLTTFMQVWKPSASSTKTRLVDSILKPTWHLSSPYSAIRMELAYGGILCSACTQVTFSLLHVTIYWFHHATVMQMWPIGHVPYAAFAQTGTATMWVPGWSAYPSRSTEQIILKCQQITIDKLRRFPEVSSIIRHLFSIGHPSVHTTVTYHRF